MVRLDNCGGIIFAVEYCGILFVVKFIVVILY